MSSYNIPNDKQILLSYNIAVSAFQSSIKDKQFVLSVDSKINTYSVPKNTEDSSIQYSNLVFLSSPIHKTEIKDTDYRAGILTEESLKTFLIDNLLVIEDGGFSIKENKFYLSNSFWTALPSTIQETELYVEEGNQNLLTYLNPYNFKRMGNEFNVFQVADFNDSTGYSYSYALQDEGSNQEDGYTVLINQWFFKDSNSTYNIAPATNTIDDLSTRALPYNYNLEIDSELLGSIDAEDVPNIILKSKYFPIGTPDPIEDTETSRTNINNQKTFLFVRNPITQETENWKLAESFKEAEFAAIESYNKIAIVDRQLGKIYFRPTYINSEFTLQEPIDSNTKIILSLPFEVTQDWGLVTCEGDVSEFYKMGPNTILIAGFPNSSHSAGSIVSNFSNLAYPRGTVYLHYNPVMPINVGYKGVNKTSKEINPLTWYEQRSIAVLTNSNIQPYTITLETVDTPYIEYDRITNTTKYGPVENQGAGVLCKGTVLSYAGKPIPSQLVTTYFKEGSGTLNDLTVLSSITNDLGEYYFTLKPERNTKWITFKREDIQYNETETRLRVNPVYLMNSTLELEAGDKETLIFMITKDDELQGTKGRIWKVPYDKELDADTHLLDYDAGELLGKVLPDTASTKIPSGKVGLVVFDFFKDDSDALSYLDGYAHIAYNTTIATNDWTGAGEDPFDEHAKIYDIIEYSEYWDDADNVPLNLKSRTYLVILENGTLTVDNRISHVSFLQRDDILYTHLNYEKNPIGRKSVLISSQTNNNHPQVPDLETLLPVTTTNYQSNTFIVPKVLPLPNDDLLLHNIAGYCLFPKQKIKIQASTVADDNIVYSNNLQLVFENSNRDKGLVKSLLGTVKIPYGFRLFDSHSENASTISTETFLTLNNLPGISRNNPKYPVISYLNGENIEYLNSEDNTAIENEVGSIQFNIEFTD